MESGRFTAAVLGFCVRLAMHFAWVSAALVGSFLDALGLIQLLGGLYEAVPKRYHVLLSSHLLLGIGVAGLGICGSGELQGWRVADLESRRAGELQSCFVYLFFRVIADISSWLGIQHPARVPAPNRFWRRLFWSFLGPACWPDYLLVSGRCWVALVTPTLRRACLAG